MADTYGSTPSSTPNRRGLWIGLIVAAVVVVGALVVFALAGGGDGGGGSGGDGGFYAVIALAADRVRGRRTRSSR
jgi:hypothetical protein